MAKVNPNFGLQGSAGNLSFYTRWDMDGVIARTKGGASKEKIKTSPKFVRTRELNAEFGGRATASQWIMHACWPLKALADHNIAGPVNTQIKPIQALDAESVRGQRHIILSANPHLLEGFSFNRRTTFDSVIRNPVGSTIDRATLSARVNIPALLPGINFYKPEKQPECPMFGVVAILGLVPDLLFTEHGYKPAKEYWLNTYNEATTPWFPMLKGAGATTLEMKLDMVPPDQSFSLVLGIGVRFGTMTDATTVEQVKRTGVAKILATA